jgi:hypothetical protein
MVFKRGNLGNETWTRFYEEGRKAGTEEMRTVYMY